MTDLYINIQEQHKINCSDAAIEDLTKSNDKAERLLWFPDSDSNFQSLMSQTAFLGLTRL